MKRITRLPLFILLCSALLSACGHGYRTAYGDCEYRVKTAECYLENDARP
jgi:hypothetical protein